MPWRNWTLGCIGILLLGLMGQAVQADAALIWDWSFSESKHDASPEDVLTLKFRLRNSPLSDQPLSGDDFQGASLSGNATSAYTVDFKLFDSLASSTLSPGASGEFVFGALGPRGGSAPPGIYHADAWLRLDPGMPEASSPVKNLEISVIDPAAPAAPEPASFYLLGAGLAALWGRKRRLKL